MDVLRPTLAVGLLVLGMTACARFRDQAPAETAIGVVVSQRVLVEGSAGSGVSVGVGAAGGSGGGTLFGLGVNIDLGRVFDGGPDRVTRLYTVRVGDGRLLDVPDVGTALPDGGCVQIDFDRKGQPRSIRPASACVR